MDLQDTEIWIPLALDEAAYATNRSSYSTYVIGRLKPGFSMEAARQEIDALAAARTEQHPELTA